MKKNRLLIMLLVFVACSSTMIGQKAESPQKNKKGEFTLIDNSSLDTLKLIFHGGYEYDYYRIYVSGFLFDEGLLFSVKSTANPHKSVRIAYDTSEVKYSNIRIEIHHRAVNLEGEYSPLWGEMDISSVIFENPPYTATLRLDSIGNNRVFKVSNSGGKLSIIPMIKGEIWD